MIFYWENKKWGDALQMWDALCVQLTLLKSADVICDSAQLHCCCCCCCTFLHSAGTQLEASGAAAALPSLSSCIQSSWEHNADSTFPRNQSCPHFHLESKTDFLPLLCWKWNTRSAPFDWTDWGESETLQHFKNFKYSAMSLLFKMLGMLQNSNKY